MLTVMKLFLFICSCVGTWEWLNRKAGISVEFLPGVTIALQTSILFLAGILNLLKEAAFLLWAAGLLYLIWVLIRDRSFGFLKEYLDVSILFCGAACMILLFFLKGKIFTHYDNFSHWALVVRRMLDTDRFPNFKDTIFVFREYPLGSSVYIYFFSKLISRSEAMQMMAQAYMMIAGILPVFGFCRKYRAASFLIAAGFANLFLVYNISVTDLPVDTLLPLSSMGALIYIYRYVSKEAGGRLAFWLSGAYLIQMMQIKNSGIFFVAAALVLILFRKGSAGDFRDRVVLASVPFLSLFLWQKHCKYVFANAENSKHAMTLENYRAVAGIKSAEQIRSITLTMIRFVFTYRDTLLLLGLFAAAGALIFFCCRNQMKLWRGLTLAFWMCFIVYQAGTLGMYILSMPSGEADRLAGIVRYTKTILIVGLYVLLILILKILSVTASVRKRAGIVFVMLLSLSGFMKLSLGEIRFAVQYRENPAKRIRIEQMKQDYQIPEGDSYCILIPKNDSDYASYVCRYVFQSEKVGSMVVKEPEDMDVITARYILIYDKKNKAVKKWVKKHAPDQTGREVIVREENG